MNPSTGIDNNDGNTAASFKKDDTQNMNLMPAGMGGGAEDRMEGEQVSQESEQAGKERSEDGRSQTELAENDHIASSTHADNEHDNTGAASNAPKSRITPQTESEDEGSHSENAQPTRRTKANGQAHLVPLTFPGKYGAPLIGDNLMPIFVTPAELKEFHESFEKSHD